MNLPLKFARRYLFAKKSTNAINIISGIAVGGIAVGTAAIILILSVFNGFEDLIKSLYGSFNPDIKITVIEGKVFTPEEGTIKRIKKIDGVSEVSQSLSEVSFFEYGESQDFGVLKGVDAAFDSVSKVDENIIRGEYFTQDKEMSYAVVGAGMEYKLSMVVGNQSQSLGVYMPNRKKRKIGFGSPNDVFKRRYLPPVGVFAIQQEFDDNYVITSLDFVQDILSYRNGEIDALEVKVTESANTDKIITEIKKIVGKDFEVKDRYQQEEAFFKLMNMEKWMAYAVISFALLLLAFNIVGALWMLVLDKKKDIAILKSMGATDDLVRNIFLSEGLALSFFGAMIGYIIAIIIYILQKTVGIVKLSGGANLLIDTYPIDIKIFDFVLVFFTVMFIGFLAAWLPSMRTKNIQPIIREE
ncbi:MAG: FtsX-like permease family protein [Saprospiraceae bacterium]